MDTSGNGDEALALSQGEEYEIQPRSLAALRSRIEEEEFAGRPNVEQREDR